MLKKVNILSFLTRFAQKGFNYFFGGREFEHIIEIGINTGDKWPRRLFAVVAPEANFARQCAQLGKRLVVAYHKEKLGRS